MDTTTLIIVGVVVLLVIVVMLVLAGRMGRRQRPELRALSPESRDRYQSQWDKVEMRFVDAPGEAVRQADALILAMLGERGHPLRESMLPANMRKARREASGRKGGDTEGMRQAILHYRAVMEEFVRPVDKREVPPPERTDHLEIA